MPEHASSCPAAEQHITAAQMHDTQTGALKESNTDAADGPFVPTVTAVSSAPGLKWMVLSTDISSVSLSSTARQKKSHHTDYKPPRKTFTGRRKGVKDQLSPEEEERRRLRRERNKLAAAKCRNRRRELTNSLQAETDSLEQDKAALQNEISNLLKEKKRLELILSAHRPHCKIPEECEEEPEEQIQTQEEHTPPHDPHSTPELHQLPTSPPQPDPSRAVISGDSDVLLCSSAELGSVEGEPYVDMRDVSMEEINTEMDSSDDMDLLVPDIALSSSLGLSEWETLYMSMGGGLEPLSSPSCGSTCGDTSTVPVFSFSSADSEKYDSNTESSCKSNAAKEILMIQ